MNGNLSAGCDGDLSALLFPTFLHMYCNLLIGGHKGYGMLSFKFHHELLYLVTVTSMTGLITVNYYYIGNITFLIIMDIIGINIT